MVLRNLELNMALSNSELTDRFDQAWKYFLKLERDAGNSDMAEVEVKDKEMIETAVLAAAFISEPCSKKQIIDKLCQNNLRVPGSVYLDSSQIHPIEMLKGYEGGNRTFRKYEVRETQKVCRTVAWYMALLKKEAERIVYEASARLTSTGKL